MTSSRTGAGDRQNEPGASFRARKYPKTKQWDMLQRCRSQMKEPQIVPTLTIGATK